MVYRERRGLHGTCNVQQECRIEHNTIRSNSHGGCVDLDDELLETHEADQKVGEEEELEEVQEQEQEQE